MAQKVRRRGGAAKIDVFNEQVSGDDCVFTRGAAKHCGIVADPRDKEDDAETGRRGDAEISASPCLPISVSALTRFRSALMKSSSSFIL